MTLFCAGCIITPGSGPLSPDVQRAREGIEPAALPYALVKLTPEVVNILGQHIPRLSTAFAAQTPPKAFRFGIGDIVSVTIFEAAAGGLFTSEAGVRAGNFVTIPNQAVDEQGNISVPYAGAIRAKGRTPFEISREITEKLQGRALEPQVVVNLANSEHFLDHCPRGRANCRSFSGQPLWRTRPGCDRTCRRPIRARLRYVGLAQTHGTSCERAVWRAHV